MKINPPNFVRHPIWRTTPRNVFIIGYYWGEGGRISTNGLDRLRVWIIYIYICIYMPNVCRTVNRHCIAEWRGTRVSFHTVFVRQSICFACIYIYIVVRRRTIPQSTGLRRHVGFEIPSAALKAHANQHASPRETIVFVRRLRVGSNNNVIQRARHCAARTGPS